MGRFQVGMMPYETVRQYNRGLLERLRESRSMRMFQTLTHYNVAF